jgi:hypothetical protein
MNYNYLTFLDGFFGSKRDLVRQRLADEVGGNFFEGVRGSRQRSRNII